MTELEPHPLAALFPPIPEEELAELGRDIALHGQLEPIVLYQGKILDGVNRYRACRLMDREPWTIEFNQEIVKRTPEQYVFAANVMRRHLTPGQLATIALVWAEQLESNTSDALFPKSEKTTGRPRTSAIPHASQSLGVRMQAVYEVQEIRAADPSLFEEVRAHSDAWLEVERVFGEKHSKWLRAGRLSDEEALEFEKLASDADKKQVRAVMLQNRSFREALATLTGLNPQNTIEGLHTKTVQSGGSFVGQIGEFLHVVAFGEKGRAELLERLKGWPAK